MTLLEALTAKREEDGKVADWANSPTMGEYAFSRDGFLGWRPSADKLFMPLLATRTLITRTDFTPMWETPAPMVPKPGEVWTREKIDIPSWIHFDFATDKLSCTWEDGSSGLVKGDMIHGQNGWRLVYSPDPERMRRV